MLQEPLSYFASLDVFNPSRVIRYAIGDKFAGLMLDDGRIGVCAVLDARVDDAVLKGIKSPVLSNQGDRVILNAYYNALFNYTMQLPANSDIFNRADLKTFGNLVIVGYFESLIAKLSDAGIRFRVFDKDDSIEGKGISPVNELTDALGKADAVIITGSSIANNTFCDLVNSTTEGCSVFLLGPSNILHPAMLRYKNVKVVFGSVFERFDHRVLDLIEEGHGAKYFLTGKNKVCMNHQAL